MMTMRSKQLNSLEDTIMIPVILLVAAGTTIGGVGAIVVKAKKERKRVKDELAALRKAQTTITHLFGGARVTEEVYTSTIVMGDSPIVLGGVECRPMTAKNAHGELKTFLVVTC
jgi:hypothetical protein